MKKFAVTILLLLYLIPTLCQCYCALLYGEFASLTFGTSEKNKCACGSKKMKKLLWRQNFFLWSWWRTSKSTRMLISFFQIRLTLILLYLPNWVLLFYFLQLKLNTISTIHQPRKHQTHILNQVFRIWFFDNSMVCRHYFSGSANCVFNSYQNQNSKKCQ